MNWTITYPIGLDQDAWAAISDCHARLENAISSGDRPLIVGSSKDLVESVAKVILTARGEAIGSNEGLQQIVGRAHQALERQPGIGLATDPPLRSIVQGAKTIASQLAEVRNRYGTGHGRATLPDIGSEVIELCADAALLWSRWALRRLEAMLSGLPTALINDLNSGIFHAGDLTARLQAANLPDLAAPHLRVLGTAVAHRAMRETFNVMAEGVDACAADPRLSTWPTAFREGLLDGLFLDKQGFIDTTCGPPKVQL